MMKPHVFTGPDLTQVFRAAVSTLGEDVAVVNSRMLNRGPERWAELIAVRGDEVERFRQELDPGPLPGDPSSGEVVRKGPVVIALVGPTGAGKTTSAAKLALSPHAFGGRKAGLLTLDTYRVGAIEQIQTYADVASLPLEVVYQTREIPGALRRLASCDVIVVDTPGRGPRASADETEWREVLQHLRPDEVHLVLPATVRFDVADFICESYGGTGVTHLLLTKLDELPVEAAVVALAGRLGLRARWVTDGQEVPADLRGAVQRMLHALGQPPITRPALAVA